MRARWWGGVGAAALGGGVSIISASMRNNMAFITVSGQPGAVNSTSPYIYVRQQHTSAKNVTGIQPVYFNGVIWAAAPTTVNNGWHEQGSGSTLGVRLAVVTNPTLASAANVGGTSTVLTWAGVIGNTSVDSSLAARGVSQFIWKLDNTGSSPTFTARTYAQFVADGGSVTSSTVNGATVANSYIWVPNGYVVIPDKGPDIAALTPYYIAQEERVPVNATATSITASAGQALVQLGATPDLRYEVNGTLTLSGATGNTSVNGVWKVSAIDRVANTVTLVGSTITTGAVTGTVTLKSVRPSDCCVKAQVTRLLDYQRSSSVQIDMMGTADWSAYTNSATDGATIGGSIAAVLGTDPTGGKNVLVQGDSITAWVRDAATVAPTDGVSTGDAYGGLAWCSRALNTARYPHIKVAVPTMTAEHGVTYGDDLIRRWMAGFCDAMINAMGHNDGGSAVTWVTQMNGNYRPLLRGTKRVVNTTLTPTTNSTDLWATSGNQTMTGATIYPTGYQYTTFIPAAKAGTLGNDAYIDTCAYASPGGVVNGLWPVDGTSYYATGDGTHPTKNTHAIIAAAVTPSVLSGALGF